MGGLHLDTTEEELIEELGRYGEIEETVIIREKESRKPRGFGFVIFKDFDSANKLCTHRHVSIRGRDVEAKLAVSADEMNKQQQQLSYNERFPPRRPSGRSRPPTSSRDRYNQPYSGMSSLASYHPPPPPHHGGRYSDYASPPTQHYHSEGYNGGYGGGGGPPGPYRTPYNAGGGGYAGAGGGAYGGFGGGGGIPYQAGGYPGYHGGSGGGGVHGPPGSGGMGGGGGGMGGGSGGMGGGSGGSGGYMLRNQGGATARTYHPYKRSCKCCTSHDRLSGC